jgi:carboxypeptidase Taq
VRQTFPAALRGVALDDFVRALNRFDPGPIRVRANRATYDLHILVRFELERELIAGDLLPEELPAAWEARYRRHLGIVPADDAVGCLQDGHWASGQFGYFPTYTLGNVYAAQLLAAARRDLPWLDRDFAAGDFVPLRNWLMRHVYSHGQRYSAVELVERASGQPPNVGPLVDALRTALLVDAA